MKLYLVHCGFYDPLVSGGAYEGHTNFFVVASDFSSARLAAKKLPDFRKYKMHVDGIQEIIAVGGHRVGLKADAKLAGKSIMKRQKFGSTKETLIES